MKKESSKRPGQVQDPRAAKILQSLREARKQAVEIARQNHAPIVYMVDGKIVRDWP